MPFAVAIRSDLTLHEVLKLDKLGASVIRTPHAGNWSPPNLALAALGIRMLANDWTVGAHDRTAHPHGVIKNGVFTPLGNPNAITSRCTVVPRQWQALYEGLDVPDSMAAAHLGAVERAFPAARVVTDTAYLQSHKEIVMSFLEAVTQREDGVRLWTRYVEGGGHVVPRTATTWNEVASRGILGVSSSPTGWMLSNELNVFLSATIESIVTGERAVFHCAGSRMVGYIRSYLPSFDRFFEIVRKTLPRSLPGMLTMHVVPTAWLRLCVKQSRKEELNRLVAAYQAVCAEREVRRFIMRQLKTQRARFEAASPLDKEKGKLYDELRAAIAGCPDIFYDVRDATFLSQHDVASGKRLYLHPASFAMTMEELRMMMLTCFRLQKPRPPKYWQRTR